MRESFYGLVCSANMKGFDVETKKSHGVVTVVCRPFRKKLKVPLENPDDYDLALRAHKDGKYISFTGERLDNKIYDPSDLEIVDPDLFNLENPI